MGNSCCNVSARIDRPVRSQKPALVDSLVLEAWYNPKSSSRNMIDASKKHELIKSEVSLTELRRGAQKYNTMEGFKISEQGQDLIPGELEVLLCDSDPTRFEVRQHQDWNCQVWKRASFSGDEITPGTELLLGNVRMKLLHLMRYKEALRMKKEVQEQAKAFSEVDCKDAECRICFGGPEDNNQLLHVCQCSGSVAFIHRKCLSHWIFGKHITLQDHLPVFKIGAKRRSCELCKQSYEPYIWSRVFEVMEVHIGTYAIFENSTPEAGRKGETKTEYVVFRFDCLKHSFSVGRTEDNDYILEDNICSRKNSSLRLEGDTLYVQDCKSRFGTNIRATGLLKLKTGRCYQIGNILLEGRKSLPATIAPNK